jgi:hypothetical protein
MLAYISGPYRAKTPNEVYDNIERARQVAIKYWKKGYTVICPHANSFMMDGIIPTNDWIKRDCEIVCWMDVVVMMKGWKNSVGAKKEHAVALKQRIKIIYE